MTEAGESRIRVGLKLDGRGDSSMSRYMAMDQRLKRTTNKQTNNVNDEPTESWLTSMSCSMQPLRIMCFHASDPFLARSHPLDRTVQR